MALAKVDSPVFVVGGPRCGTTLTARILNNHPNLFMPGETHFFDDIYSKKDSIGDVANPESMKIVHAMLADLYGRYNEPEDQKRVKKLLLDALSLAAFQKDCKTYKDVLDFFMCVQMRHVGKSRWGNNTPRDLYNVNEIMGFYPNSKFIVCVRDVRDFMLSYKNKWRREHGDNSMRLKKLYHPVATAFQWKSIMRLALGMADMVRSENLYTVRYEDLVTRPEETVRGICAAIGEEYVPTMLEVVTHNSSNQQSGGGIFTSSIGRWRQKLPVEEAYVGQLIGKNEMSRCGYAQEEIRPSLARMAWLAATMPFGLGQALVANRNTRGPLVPYLIKRIKPLLGLK